MPVPYQVVGNYVLPCKKNQQGTKWIVDDVKRKFAQSAFADKKGCYVFGIRTAKGAICPHYVGQTSTNFLSECFTDHKLKKYNHVLHEDSHGTPILFFVSATKTKGPVNMKALRALEDYLIGLGFKCNANLKNIRGKKNFEPPFKIKGIHSKELGKPSEVLRGFRRMLSV